MTFFRNILRSIYFVVVLFFETLINFLTGIDWMVISPFFLLIYYISVKSFSNHNIKLVSGIRFNRKDNIIKKISSRIANFVRRFYLNDNCVERCRLDKN